MTKHSTYFIQINIKIDEWTTCKLITALDRGRRYFIFQKYTLKHLEKMSYNILNLQMVHDKVIWKIVAVSDVGNGYVRFSVLFLELYCIL